MFSQIYFVTLQPREIVDSSCMACLQRARDLLYALTTSLRYDARLATAYFSTKKGNRAKVQNAWDQIARQMAINVYECSGTNIFMR